MGSSLPASEMLHKSRRFLMARVFDKPFQVAGHRVGITFRYDRHGIGLPGLDHDMLRLDVNGAGDSLSVLFGGGDPCVISFGSSDGVVNDSITDASRFEPIDEQRQLAAPVLGPLHVELHGK